MANEEKIYVGQTALQIQLDTKIDLTLMQSALIKYNDPDGNAGSWAASLIDLAIDGIIGTASEPTLIEGLWKVWSHITFTDARTAPGDPVTFYAYTEGH